MTQTIDVTGLPEATIRCLEEEVRIHREDHRPELPRESAEQWCARWKQLLDEFAVPGVVILDDRREALYADERP